MSSALPCRMLLDGCARTSLPVNRRGMRRQSFGHESAGTERMNANKPPAIAPACLRITAGLPMAARLPEVWSPLCPAAPQLTTFGTFLKGVRGNFSLELSSQVQRLFEKNFFRRPPAQGFTWAPVQKRSDGIHIRLSNLGKGGAFRKELTQ